MGIESMQKSVRVVVTILFGFFALPALIFGFCFVACSVRIQPPPLSVIETAADRVPIVVGLNFGLMKQLEPAATLVPQLFGRGRERDSLTGPRVEASRCRRQRTPLI